MRVRTAALTATLLLAYCGQAQAAPHRVTVRSTVSGPSGLPAQCSAHSAESQPLLVSDPSRPRSLTALYFQDGTLAAVGAQSRDGGRSWTRRPIPGATRCSGGDAEREFTVNPQLAAGGYGQSYAGTSWYGTGGGPTFNFGTLVHRSAGIREGFAAGTAQADGPAQNLSLAADPERPGRLFAAWNHFEQAPNPFTYVPVATEVRAARSGDGGQTFRAPVVAARPPDGSSVINVRQVRLPDGALVVFYDVARTSDLPGVLLLDESVSFDLYTTRSTDDGATWSPPKLLATMRQEGLPDPEGRDPANAPGGTIAGIGKFDVAVGADGTVVAVWARRRADGGGAVSLVRSSDGGRSWTGGADVLSRRTPLFMPAVAAAADGTLGVMFYDFERDQLGDHPLTTDLWLATARRGRSAFKVTSVDRSFDLRGAYEDGVTYDGTALGVYQDLVALRNDFGAAYTVGPPLAGDGTTDVRFSRVRR